MGDYVFTESWDYYWNGTATPNGSQAQWVKGFLDQELVPGRFGGRCLQHARAGGTEDIHCDLPAGNITTGEITIGFAWRVSNALSRNLMVLNQAGGTTAQFSIYQNSDGSISVRNGNGGTVLGTSATGLLTLLTWCYIEVSVVIGNSGSLTLDLNGTEVINVSGVDTMGAANVNVGRITLPEPASSGTMWYDDLYVRDDLIKAGPSAIVYRRALAAVPGGDFNMTATSAYIHPLLVDDFAADTASYITGDAVSEDQFFTMENLSKLSGSGVRAITIIGFAKVNSGTGTVDAIVNSNGDTSISSWNLDTTFRFRRKTVTLDPDTGALWTRGALAAMQAGIAITAMAGGATEVQLSMLGYEALVPLTPAYNVAGGHRYWSARPVTAAGTERPGTCVFALYGPDGEYLQPHDVIGDGGDYSGGLARRNVADGRKDTNWVSASHYSTTRLTLDYGGPVIAKTLRLGAQNDSTSESFSDFTIEFSDDNVSWTTFYEADPQAAWSVNEIRTFTLPDIIVGSFRRRQTLIMN